jgi:hypothetical protein
MATTTFATKPQRFKEHSEQLYLRVITPAMAKKSQSHRVLKNIANSGMCGI